MSKIEITCPNCGREGRVPESFAGRKTKCPSCNAAIDIPDPHAALDLAEEEEEEDDGRECPDCGAELRRKARKCRACGLRFDRRGRPIDDDEKEFKGPPPDNHMGKAIFSLVCCCWPLGIVAVINAAQVSSKWAAGDYQGARQASAQADQWATYAIVLGIVGNAIGGGLQVLIAAGG